MKFAKVTTWIPVTDEELDEIAEGSIEDVFGDLARMALRRGMTVVEAPDQVPDANRVAELKFVTVGCKVEVSNGGDLALHLQGLED